MPSSPVYLLAIEPDAPFRLDLTVWALRRRPHNMVDRWEASTYWRTLPVDGAAIAVGVSQSGTVDAPRLLVSFAGAGLGPSAELSACNAMHALLGLDVDVSPFAAAAARDTVIGPLAARLRGLRPPRFPSVFESLVNGVACQQLSLSVGIHLINRLTAAHGRPPAGDPAGARASPIRNSSRAWIPASSDATASARPSHLRSSRSPVRSFRTIWTSRRCISSRTQRRSSS